MNASNTEKHPLLSNERLGRFVVLLIFGLVIATGELIFGWRHDYSNLAILLLVGALLIWLIIELWIFFRRKKSGPTTQEAVSAQISKTEAAADRKDQAEILLILKKMISELNRRDNQRRATGSRFRRALDFFHDRDSLYYQSPWFIVIGRSGSGKTQILDHLENLANERSNDRILSDPTRFSTEQANKEGTSTLNVLVCNEAVFIDTAGKFTGWGDAVEKDWDFFLETVKSQRKVQPINGAIVTLDYEDIALGQVKVDEYLHQIKRLHESLEISFPIFLVVTKCDLCEGFVEIFRGMTGPARAGAWGIHDMLRGAYISDRGSGNDRKRTVDMDTQWRDQFDSIVQNLRSRANHRIQFPDNVDLSRERNGRLLNFPLDFGSEIRENLKSIVHGFASSLAVPDPAMIRGVYFTSCIQKATPLPISQKLLWRITKETRDPKDLASKAPSKDSTAYFLDGLFGSVILRERWIAGTQRRQKYASVMKRAIIPIASGIVGLGILAWWSLDYQDLKTELTKTASKLKEFNQLTSSDIDGILSALDTLPCRTIQPSRMRISGLDPVEDTVDACDALHAGIVRRDLVPALLDEQRRLLQQAYDQVKSAPAKECENVENVAAQKRYQDALQKFYGGMIAYAALRNPRNMPTSLIPTSGSKVIEHPFWSPILGKNENRTKHILAYLTESQRRAVNIRIWKDDKDIQNQYPLEWESYKTLLRKKEVKSEVLFTALTASDANAKLTAQSPVWGFYHGAVLKPKIDSTLAQPEPNDLPVAMFSKEGFVKFLKSHEEMVSNGTRELNWLLNDGASKSIDLSDEVLNSYLNSYHCAWRAFLINGIKLRSESRPNSPNDLSNTGTRLVALKQFGAEKNFEDTLLYVIAKLIGKETGPIESGYFSRENQRLAEGRFNETVAKKFSRWWDAEKKSPSSELLLVHPKMTEVLQALESENPGDRVTRLMEEICNSAPPELCVIIKAYIKATGTQIVNEQRAAEIQQNSDLLRSRVSQACETLRTSAKGKRQIDIPEPELAQAFATFNAALPVRGNESNTVGDESLDGSAKKLSETITQIKNGLFLSEGAIAQVRIKVLRIDEAVSKIEIRAGDTRMVCDQNACPQDLFPWKAGQSVTIADASNGDATPEIVKSFPPPWAIFKLFPTKTRIANIEVGVNKVSLKAEPYAPSQDPFAAFEKLGGLCGRLTSPRANLVPPPIT